MNKGQPKGNPRKVPSGPDRPRAPRPVPKQSNTAKASAYEEERSKGAPKKANKAK